MNKVASPCINICEFTGPNKWCVGCGRTRIECDEWRKMKPYDRKNLSNTLAKRMLKMKVEKSRSISK